MSRTVYAHATFCVRLTVHASKAKQISRNRDATTVVLDLDCITGIAIHVLLCVITPRSH